VHLDLVAVGEALSTGAGSVESTAAPLREPGVAVVDALSPPASDVWIDAVAPAWSGLQWMLVVYGLIAAGLLLWRGLGLWRGHRALRGRVEVFDPRLLASLSRLRQAAGLRRPVRLSQHPGLRSPIAFGLLDAEICLPAAALSELGAGRQECVLAHEVAHLRGRDPWWQLGVELVACVSFFQPLLFVARRRLRELAEFRCDAWVVAQTGDRAAMAHTLVEVAGWLAAPRGDGCPQAVSMAHHGSPLRERVRLILDGDPRRTTPTEAGLGLLLWLLLGGIGYTLPAVHCDPAPRAATGVQRQLAALEGEIAALHEQLAVAWRRLEGRDQPGLTALLHAVEEQLQQVTERHRALCREAAAPARAATTPQTNRAQLDFHPHPNTK
jgi:hypothetical protein